MANTILITANWHTGALSQQTISRQYDNNRYVVQFVGYPEASEGNELDYYLLVWMSSAPGEKPDEIAPIQLASDQWYISNVFTQQTQQIKFQMCALNTAGTFEAHSPIFTGFVRNSLEHDGTAQDIDVSTLFDAYREYLNELIIRSGAVVIDSVPTQGSNNAVSSGGVYSALAGKVDAETGKGLSANDYTNADKQAVTDATADLSAITTATASDVGKALKAKTVTNGKVVEWEFGETGGAEIESITKRFEKLYADGSGGFDSALFVNGGMSSGQIIYGQEYRVTTNELFSFTRDVTISAQDGYRFGVHVFVDGTFDSDSGWKTSLDVSAGTTFKIVIAKQTEDTSVVADIEEFVNAIDISTFISDTRKQVEQLDEELTGEITDLQSEIDRLKSKSLPASVASAILQTLKGVAWASENGGQMINALHDALFGGVGKSYTLYDYITPTADHPFRNASGIATAVDFDPTCSIETTIYYTNSVKTSAANILGSKNSASGKVIGLFATPSTGKLGYWYFGKDTVNNITPLSANQKFTITVKPVGASETYPNNVVIDVNGTEYNSGVTMTSYDCPSWLGFFNYTIGDEINANGVMYDIGLRIGRTIVRSANGVMRNCLIPAHDGTRYGLYDSMNDRFFYNETYADKYTCGYWEQEGGD